MIVYLDDYNRHQPILADNLQNLEEVFGVENVYLLEKKPVLLID